MMKLEKSLAPLKVVSGAYRGMPFSISSEMAEEIIREFGLKLECRNGDMSGEKSALFEWEGVTLRIKQTWTRHWELYKGDWKPDPHWTGD